MSLSSFIKKLILVGAIFGAKGKKLAGINDKLVNLTDNQVIYDSLTNTITFTNQSSLPSWLVPGKYFRTYDGILKTVTSSSDPAYIAKAILNPDIASNSGVLFKVISVVGNVITIDPAVNPPVDRNTGLNSITIDGRVAIVVNDATICRLNAVGSTVYNPENQTATAVPGDGSGIAGAFADHFHGGQAGSKPFPVQYVDQFETDITSVIGASYAPDGTDVVNGDLVLFPNLTDLIGPTGRGVYSAQVDGLGNLTGWLKIVFGGDPAGNSKAGDLVFVDYGATQADHTWQCYDTPGALWKDLGISGALVVKDEGVIVDVNTLDMNFTGEWVNVTSPAATKVEVNIDPARTVPFVIADWLLDIPSGLYYFDAVHNLGSSGVNVYVGQGALGFKTEMHQITIPDANTVRLWIVSNPDTRFDGYCKVIK